MFEGQRVSALCNMTGQQRSPEYDGIFRPPSYCNGGRGITWQYTSQGSGILAMGLELWTSPVTGYRRKGTRLAELRSLIDSGITVRAILEPLQSCRADAPAAEAAQVLRRRDYDVAGVKRQPAEPVIGWVAAESLTRGRVEDHVKPITMDTLISDGTPLPTVLKTLKGRPHTFVLVGSEVAGIVTRADLNNPPVRVYLFTLISLLEMHLSFWVRAEYPDDSWQKKLTSNRLAAAHKIQKLRGKRNQNPFLVECLQFCDKGDLVAAREGLRTRLSMGTRDCAASHLKQAEDLRNVQAHSQHELVDGSSWGELIDVVEWVETLVHTSDRKIEQTAAAAAAGQEDGLWASA